MTRLSIDLVYGGGHIGLMGEVADEVLRGGGLAILPGGVGTMEEFFGVWCWSTLGLHAKPVGLLNTNDNCDPLIEFVRHAGSEGFVRSHDIDALTVASDPDELLARLGHDLRAGPS